MATQTNSQKLILPDYIQDVTGNRPKAKGRVKIPTYDELPKVKGIFKNIEAPGTGISFPYRTWKGSPKIFTFFDGCEYIIPKDLADHLNNECAHKIYQWRSNGEVSNVQPIMVGGRGFRAALEDPTKELKTKKNRFMFQILGDA